MSTKSSSKGNRVSSLIEQLSKLWPSQGNIDEHDVENIKYVTNKIQQLVSSQEKCRKDLMLHHEESLTILLSVLKVFASVDLQITFNILSILNEVLTSGKRIAIVMDHNAINVAFHVLNVTASKETRDCHLLEDVLTTLHTLLSKLGNKDKSFCVQARLSGVVSVTLTIGKQYSHSFKVLLPVLQVLKIYANSSVNCAIMVKGGAVGLLVKTIPHCGLKRTVTLKLSIELLSSLVKTKNGAKKAVVSGAVPMLLSMYLEWQRLDHRNRQMTLRKAILNCLRGIIMCSSGRKALLELDGLKVLYTIGYDGLDAREMEGTTKLLILILRRLVTSKLLSKSCTMLVTFALGDRRSGVMLKKSESVSRPSKSIRSDEALLQERAHDESDEDSDDEGEVDTVGDEDDQVIEPVTPVFSPVNSTEESPPERTDLDMYRVFMPEFVEFEAEDASMKQKEQGTEIRQTPIIIPTAHMEIDMQITSNCYMSGTPDTEATMASVGGASVPKCPYTGEHNHCRPSSSNHLMSKVDLSSMEVMVEGIRIENGDDLCIIRNESCISYGKSTYGQGVTGDPSSDFMCRGASQAKRECVREDIGKGVFHLLPFVKQTEPEKLGHYPPAELEPLLDRKPGLPRAMVFQDFARFLQTDKVINRLVYDIDESVKGHSASSNLKAGSQTSLSSSSSSLNKEGHPSSSSCSNKNDDVGPTLKFESRFECGNLRRVFQVRQHEYDLILSPDINTDHHHQWFYFEVQNMEAGVPYKFNIINCEKFNSQFNFGMQPVMYSTKEALEGRAGWERTGYNVCYYKNYFVRTGLKQNANRYYYTTTFTIKFPHGNDICYLAYHYPYSYSMLKSHLSTLESRLPPSVLYSRQVLCKTLLGNSCDILTVTAKPDINDDEAVSNFRKRPYIILTGRVHPGESSASWIMKGVLDFLLSSNVTAEVLRSTYIFKIVPMLNPDGVINGCHRCSVAGEDLNRKWINPDSHLHPTIFHIKGLMQYLISISKTPLVYCDFHGHSRRKNVFMYGCSMAATANARAQGNLDASKFHIPRFGDIKFVDNPETNEVSFSVVDEDTGYRTLPKILNAVAPAFSIQNCNYIVEKSKEGTGRVVVYKELGVLRSYTMESTYCGADQGPYKGYHFSTRELEEMGKDFCIGLHKLSQSYRVKLSSDYFLEPQFDLSPEGETLRDEDDDSFDLNQLPSESRLGLLEEPLLEGVLGTAED